MATRKRMGLCLLVADSLSLPFVDFPFDIAPSGAFLFGPTMATRKRKVVAIVEEPTSTCGHCKHAWFVEDQHSAVWFCRRYPPTVTYDIGEQTQVSSFPVIAADIACGEFSPKLND